MSSSRSTQNYRQDGGNKGFNRTTQKKFVPKNQSSIRGEPSSMNNPPLTTSLRDPSTSIDSSATSSSTSTARVRIGDNGDWESSRKQVGNSFVNYLPQDEAVAAGLGVEDGALDPVESQRVVDLLNRELSRMLKLSPKDFWREVASDASLHDFLDSFLQFRNRWYDFPHHGAKGIVAGVIVGELELCRRVFMILYRISSNKDPGALAVNSLSAKEHGALLQEKKLLQLPKLLDICAIYGHENEEMTSLLVMNAMKAQPRLHENLTEVVSQFLSITHTMHERCNSSLEALLSSGSWEDNRDSRLLSDFSEVMDFINDAVASLDAFVNAYKPAAVYFSCLVEVSYGNGELLTTLARLHDSLLPSLQGGFGHAFSAGGDGNLNSFTSNVPNMAISFKMLSARIVSLGWKMLDICYLSEEVFKESYPLPTATKMFPANVDDPAIRGDILVQSFREINDEVSHHINKNRGTFLQRVEKDHKILNKLNDLQGNGWLFLDDEQFQYLSHMLMPPQLEAVNKGKVPVTTTVNKVHMDEDAAVIESKISQVKDLFPDYGVGFVAACLDVYNQNPEEVIQRILEGTLHEDLQLLDISLEKIPPPKSTSSLSRKDKGKGILLEEEPRTSPSINVVTAAQEKRNEGHPSSVGRYTRKANANSLNTKVLDSAGDDGSLKTAILAAQYEYEDEYDDSFDDLGLSVVESGYNDTEIGDRISSGPGKSWGGEAESASQDKPGPRWNTRKTPQFYVKDGKNYSYKVSGAVAVANSQEAALLNQVQKDTIHGLGRGGNLPHGSVKVWTELNDKQHQQDSEVSEAPEAEGSEGNTGNSRGRGGRRGGAGNRYRKDRAMKKHFAGLGGF